MSELISGKEAKLAWANDDYVEYMLLDTWDKLGGSTPLSIFDRDDAKFRLKPQTIKINGIEVEKPKDIAVDPVTGSVRFFYGDLEKTQQAYEALRSIFNG